MTRRHGTSNRQSTKPGPGPGPSVQADVGEGSFKLSRTNKLATNVEIYFLGAQAGADVAAEAAEASR